jgi:hypothetical protein
MVPGFGFNRSAAATTVGLRVAAIRVERVVEPSAGTVKLLAVGLAVAEWAGQPSGMTTPTRSRYAGHRFPAEIISHAIWLYFRFPLGLRKRSAFSRLTT